MAVSGGGTCEPAPQTRGLPRGMAAGWWGLGRGGGGPRGGFGHLGEGDGAVEVRVGAVAALLPAELGVEQVAAAAQHAEVGRPREVPLDKIGQASCRERVVRTCRYWGSPFH